MAKSFPAQAPQGLQGSSHHSQVTPPLCELTGVFCPLLNDPFSHLVNYHNFRGQEKYFPAIIAEPSHQGAQQTQECIHWAE